MKTSLLTIVTLLILLGTNKAQAQTNAKTEIEQLIFSYRDALNASDASKVVSLYTADGVLLANAAPTAEGAQHVKGTYQYVFDNFKYNLEFTIIEIVVNGNYAFARSTSKGSFVIKASGQTIADENRELFVFEKVNGQWKIARYMYNKTK
jgi:uncharacterized protein (TIGR02246 family)